MDKTKELALGLIRKQIPDEELRRKVTPDYAVGCKRLLISGNYYPALTRSNVNLITDPVRTVYDSGVESGAGERRDVDAIIFGTGFDAQQGLLGFPLAGLGGRTLADAWAGGKEAYLGTTVAGFPNFFMMIGPNSGLAHNSQIFMIEAQARYIASALRKLLKRPAAAVAVRPELQRRYNDWLAARLKNAVWNRGGCTSWYLDPVTGRNTLLWPSSAFAFWRRLRRFRAADYRWTNTTPSPVANAAPAPVANAR
jgi:cation diffusion facilitator CzcD-associated flavoprotein CzcO